MTNDLSSEWGDEHLGSDLEPQTADIMPGPTTCPRLLDQHIVPEKDMANINNDKLATAALSRSQRTEGVTLVAGYGEEKPDGFESALAVLTDCCKAATSLSGWIRLYARTQVHATIVGLEGKRRGNSVVQMNVKARMGGAGPGPAMNVEAFLAFFKQSGFRVPMVVGKFGADEINPFDPTRKPFQRSFDIRSDGLLVGMGWPYSDVAFEPHLLALRKYLETFNIVHKYHVPLQDQDNDLFFVIGEIDSDKWKSASVAARAAVQEAVDDLVAECRRVLLQHRHTFSLHARDFRVVRYLFTSLAEVAFSERVTEIDSATFLELYPDSTDIPA